MSQTPAYPCPKCATPVQAGQRFCPNCGTPMPAPNAYQQAPQAPQYNVNQQQGQGGYGIPPVPPSYAAPAKKKANWGLRIGIILLLLLVVICTGGYFAFKYLGSRITSGLSNITAVTPTQAPLKTTSINATVNYASVDITIVNAQQASSFADDPDTSNTGVVRLNIHAVQSDVNDTAGGSSIAQYYDYPSAFRLLLPGGSKIALAGAKDLNGPTHAGNQTNWIDFSVPTTTKVDQLTLQIGKDTEAQLEIPLTGHADLSKYQSKQINPNKRVQYGAMFWTLVQVATKLSDSGAQADKGMHFLVLSFNIDNPSTQDNNGYPPDYIHLQYGSTNSTPTGNAIGNAKAGATNVKGIVSFLVPDGTTSFTLMLLANGLTGATSDTSIPFQIS